MSKSYQFVVYASFCVILVASSLHFATCTVFKDCIEGLIGAECNRTCNCSVLGTSTCDKVSGTCQCKSGWSGTDCDKDVDECLQNTTNCPSHSHCVNTVGGFDCLCDDGFSNSSNKCEDINECTLPSKNKCGIKISCVNTIGNYTCSCPEGQMLDSDGRSCNTCSDETWGFGCNHTCNCGVGTDYCDVRTGCVCKQGYTGTSCDRDINECTTGVITCRSNEYCVNLIGSAMCNCKPGNTRGNGICNECKEGTWGTECGNNCSCSVLGTSTCDKVSGTCQCKSGWSGTNCDKDVDECLLNVYTCPSHSICINNIGGYSCTCDDGFLMARNKCEDINECSLLVQICEQICINTVGGMNCSCREGFSISPKDSTKCIEISTYDIQVVFNLTSDNLQLDNKKSTDYMRIMYEVESQMLKVFHFANFLVLDLKVTDLRKGSLIADIKIFIDGIIKIETELSTSLKQMENCEVTLNDNQAWIQSIGFKDQAGSGSQQSTLGIYIGVPLGGGTVGGSLLYVFIYCCKKRRRSQNKNQNHEQSPNVCRRNRPFPERPLDVYNNMNPEKFRRPYINENNCQALQLPSMSDESDNHGNQNRSLVLSGLGSLQNVSSFSSELGLGNKQFKEMNISRKIKPNPNGGLDIRDRIDLKYHTDSEL